MGRAPAKRVASEAPCARLSSRAPLRRRRSRGWCPPAGAGWDSRPVVLTGGGGDFGPPLPISQTAIALAEASGHRRGMRTAQAYLRSGAAGAAGVGDGPGERNGGGRGSSSDACPPSVAAWRRVVQRAVASESSRSGADRIDNLYGLLRDCWRADREPATMPANTWPDVPKHLCDQFWAEVDAAKAHRRARDQLTLAQGRGSVEGFARLASR